MDNQPQPGGVISPSGSAPAGPEPVAPTPTPSPAPPAPVTPELTTAPIAPATPVAPATTPPPAPVAPEAPQHMAAFMNPDAPTTSPVKVKGPKKMLKVLMVALVALFVLGGGSTAAYFGYVLPNKPENKLLSAFANAAAENNTTVEGTVAYTPESGGLGISVDYKAAANRADNKAAISGTFGMSGASVPYEMRYLDKDVYFKVSGLDSVSALATADSPYAALSPILKQIDNQWYVVDSSFFQSLGKETSCVADLSFTLTDADISLIKKAYGKHPLFSIKSSSKETLDGESVTKYVVNPSSDETASAFAKDLENLSIVSKIKECTGENSVDTATADEVTDKLKDSTGVEMSISVNNKKQLKKLELTQKEDGNSVKISAKFSYGAVTVDKPEGAKSALDLYSSIFAGTFMELSGAQGSARDTERQTDIKATHAQVEAYYAQNGYYPGLADLNNASFVSTNLKGLNTDAFQDPEGTDKTLVAAAKKNTYSYTTSPATCTAAKKDCLTYTLSATLSDGSLYTKNSLN